MLNKIQNIKKSSKLSFAMYTATFAVAIYGTIILRFSAFKPVEKIEKFIPVPEVTAERGLYINDRRIPLDALQPGKEIQLPYGAISDKEGGLRFLVDDAGLDVEVYSRNGSKWTLESKVEPGTKDKEGKDGLSLSGRLSDAHRIVVRAPSGKYDLVVSR